MKTDNLYTKMQILIPFVACFNCVIISYNKKETAYRRISKKKRKIIELFLEINPG